MNDSHKLAENATLTVPTGQIASRGRENSRPPKSSEIREILENEIQCCVLKPGEALDERALALRFGVSRTPIREVLPQLAASGLITIVPNVGAHVTQLSVGEVRALLEFITESEATCAKLCARRIDTETTQALQAALDDCARAAAEGEGYSKANVRFHEVIYEGSRNPYLAMQIRTARGKLQRYRVKDLKLQSHVEQSLEQHREIAAAIKAGDELRAAQLMERHLPSGGTGFSEFLAKLPASVLAQNPS